MRGKLALVSLTLSVALSATAQSTPPKAVAAGGLRLARVNNRLVVVGATLGSGPQLQLGDQIVAVNGSRVSTPAAVVNRLSQAKSITVVRKGALQVLTAPAAAQANSRASSSPTTAGWMNPDQMVRTSQGVMHREAAARLGLVGTPLVVTAAEREAYQRAVNRGGSAP